MNKPQLDGDRAFLGVDMRRDPAMLEPGLVAAARNARFRGGTAATRPGIQQLNWTQAIGTPFPIVFPFEWDQALPFVAVYGAGRFDDPNSGEWVVIAAARAVGEGKVWVTRASNKIHEEALPAGETIDGPVTFVQANDKLIMLRGEDAAPLVLERVGFGWRTLEEPEEGTGTVKIPNASQALYFQNQLALVHGRDQVAISDYLEPERYSETTNNIAINQGSSDRLVGIYKFNDTTVVASKESSLYVIGNLVPNAEGRYDGLTLDVVTMSWGWIARKSVVHVGGDLLGLSQFGVMSLRQTTQNKLQGVEVPLSADIQPLIDRINWTHAAGACGAYWDSKYYLAAPLDDAEKLGNEIIPEGTLFGDPATDAPVRIYGLEPGRQYRVTFLRTTLDGVVGEGVSKVVVSGEDGPREYLASLESFDFTAEAASEEATSAYIDIYAVHDDWSGEEIGLTCQELYTGVNNGVLVFDFVTGKWCGLDDGDGIMVSDWVTLDYQGRERLFYLSPDGFLYLYEEGFEDEVYKWVGYPALLPEDYEHAVGVEGREIELDVLTRGYGTRQLQNDGMSVARLGEIRAKGALLEIATWNPSFTISEKPDGANEEAALLEDVTRSRSRYAVFGTPAYDTLNGDDDHANPGREDYSLALVEEDGILLGSGIEFNLHQVSQERVRFHGRGGSVQVRVVNGQGRLELKRVELESVAGRERYGTRY